jgi:hypothetical protein
MIYLIVPILLSLLKIAYFCQAWGPMPAIPAHRRKRRENGKFEGSVRFAETLRKQRLGL